MLINPAGFLKSRAVQRALELDQWQHALNLTSPKPVDSVSIYPILSGSRDTISMELQFPELRLLRRLVGGSNFGIRGRGVRATISYYFGGIPLACTIAQCHS